MKIKFLIFCICATCFSFGALADDCGPASMLVNGSCVCVFGAVLNEANGECECKLGSELNIETNTCECKGNFGRYGTDECVCNPGFFLHDDGSYWCGKCYKGTFKSEYGNQACTPCPAHQTTAGVGVAAMGAQSVDACVCDMGYYLYETNEVRLCLACPAGTYKSFEGNDRTCEPCQPAESGETYSEEGAANCSLCPRGFCCFDGAKYDCNIGTYSSGMGLKCAEANPTSAHPQCESKDGECPAPLAAVYTPGACTSCPSGCSTRYKNSAGFEQCTEKTVSEFCISATRCFKLGNSAISQSMNSNIPNNLVCPRYE